jgi:hypothetical protein
MSSTPILNTLVTVFSTMLSLAMEIALLVIALTTVRSRRPEATLPLAAGAGIHLGATVLQTLVYSFILPALAASGPDYRTLLAVAGLFFALLRTVAWGAILFGIVKLAGPGGAPRDPTRYS